MTCVLFPPDTFIILDYSNNDNYQYLMSDSSQSAGNRLRLPACLSACLPACLPACPTIPAPLPPPPPGARLCLGAVVVRLSSLIDTPSARELLLRTKYVLPRLFCLTSYCSLHAAAFDFQIIGGKRFNSGVCLFAHLPYDRCYYYYCCCSTTSSSIVYCSSSSSTYAPVSQDTSKCRVRCGT